MINNIKNDALIEALVDAFYERFPSIADREDLTESELREALAAGVARALPPG